MRRPHRPSSIRATQTLGALAALAALAACGDEPVGPTPVPLPCAELTEGVAPRITRFEPSRASVMPYETVELAWRVEGACLVEVTSPTDTLAASHAAEGRATTRALAERTTFVLTARGRGATSTSSVTVDVEWAAPRIDELFGSSDRPRRFDSFTLWWATSNHRTLRLFENGREVYASPVDSPSSVRTTMTRQITTTTTTYQLEVSNPTGTVSRELIVVAGETSYIDYLRVSPAVFVGQAFTATLSWSVTPPAPTELYVDGELRADFPGTPVGEWSLPVSGPRSFTLQTQGASATVNIAVPETEREPNGFVQSANLLSLRAVLGELSTADDVDVFELQGIPPGRVRIVTTRLGGVGCDTDTRLVVSTFGDRILADVGDGGALAPSGGACAVTELELLGDVRALFVEVHAERDDSGPYLLSVE